MGLRPIILERGKLVRERTRDTWGLWRRGVLNPESNVQFGEGGAGTFSDGKLYSGIKDPRHLGRKVLDEFVEAGAPEEILLRQQAAYRHLPPGHRWSRASRATIEALGGEYRFGAACDDIVLDRRRRAACAAWRWPTASRSPPTTWCWRSATARATRSRCCIDRGVQIEAKPFSIGVRIEHPQSLIDRARFGACGRTPAARARPTTSWCTTASNGRSVYSFCMCPGGRGGGGDVGSRAAS